MEKSESIKNLAKALSEFQSEMPIVNLDREVEVTMKSGGKYKFSYATFRNIIEIARPILSKYKLSFSQLVEQDSSVTTMLMHESGEFISSSLLIIGEKTPQGIGSAITYAKRYSLSSILGIVADDDDDGNIAEGNHYAANDDNKKWLNRNTEEWKKAVEYLKGGGKIEKISEKYKINKQNREELLSQAI